MCRGQDDLKPLVLAIFRRAGWAVDPQIVSPDATGQVHTDLEQIGRVQSRWNAGCAVLALGSGTIADIAKHACYRFEVASGDPVPLVIFQTANSVSAYTSNMAPTFVDGVKRTLPSRLPDALVCDLETLRDAPYAMTAAGVGDLLAAGVSFADWYLANSLGLDPTYSPLAECLMGRLDVTLLELAAGVRQWDLEAMGAAGQADCACGAGDVALARHNAPLGFRACLLARVRHGSRVAPPTVGEPWRTGCLGRAPYVRRLPGFPPGVRSGDGGLGPLLPRPWSDA